MMDGGWGGMWMGAGSSLFIALVVLVVVLLKRHDNGQS
jgi:hypothetical protein